MGQRFLSVVDGPARGAPNPGPVATWRNRLWPHLVAYAFLLVVITAVIPLDASFGGDDGAYGGQVYALENGGWALERPLATVDASNEGWLNTAITPDGPLPYTSNPAYALLLASLAGAGTVGMHAVPLLGAIVSAAMAWALSRRLVPNEADTGRAVLAFWLVALGPVLVNSTTLWAHTISTALGGGSLWCLLALAAPARPDGVPKPAIHTAALVAGLAATLAAAALVRTEAVFWIIALAVTAAVAVAGRAARIGAAGSVVVGLGAWVANRSWGAALRADGLSIDTAVVETDGATGWMTSRLPAAWRLLLTSLGGGIGPMLALVAISVAVVAAVKLRRAAGGAASDETEGTTGTDRAWAETRFAAALLVGSAAVYLLHAVLAPGETVSGTVAAWPVVFVLLIAGRDRVEGLALLLLPVGLFALAVLATQYSISGGHQWGGRYLSMVFVPLAVAAAARGWPVLVSPASRAGILAVLVAPALVGVAASYRLHVNHRDIVAATTSIPAEVVITDTVALPRIAWTALPTAFYVADVDDVDRLLDQLAAAEVESVNIHGLRDHPIDGTAGYRVTAIDQTIRHLELDPAP